MSFQFLVHSSSFLLLYPISNGSKNRPLILKIPVPLYSNGSKNRPLISQASHCPALRRVRSLPTT